MIECHVAHEPKFSILQVKWGCDLQSEHERYITEEAFAGSPVIIRDYPKVFVVHLMVVFSFDAWQFYIREQNHVFRI